MAASPRNHTLALFDDLVLGDAEGDVRDRIGLRS